MRLSAVIVGEAEEDTGTPAPPTAGAVAEPEEDPPRPKAERIAGTPALVAAGATRLPILLGNVLLS